MRTCIRFRIYFRARLLNMNGSKKICRAHGIRGRGRQETANGSAQNSMLARTSIFLGPEALAVVPK
jgi:hypothetical protein